MKIALLAAAALVAAPVLAADPGVSPGPVTPRDPTQIPVATGWTSTALLSGLEHPWGMAFLPNGDMLITERPGRLRYVAKGKLEPRPIDGVPPVLAHRQGGLLDVSLHPDFARNRLIYLTLSQGTEEANATRVVRARLDGRRLTQVREIFRVGPDKRGGFHFGARIVWLPDGTMLVGLGDGGFTRDRVQDLDNHFGKIVRLKDDGSVATDNPFHARADAKPEVFTYGHRNIQGFARDPETGRLWATEHGAQGGDELNLIRPGANYGWMTVTYAVEYGQDRKLISTRQSAPGMDDPKAVWTPSIAPSGLAVYRGDRFPAWRGDIFAGGLITGARANPGSVFRIRVNADGAVVGQERLPMPARVRDVRQGPDGDLYVLTDEANGQLIRISPAG